MERLSSYTGKKFRSGGVKEKVGILKSREVFMLRIGDVAPDFTLTTIDGDSLSLAEARQTSQSVLLVFLRHLG